MASIKVKFRPSTLAGREGSIYYMIIHGRRQRQYYPEYHVYPYEWDENRSNVISSPESHRSILILKINKQIRCDLQRFMRIINNLSNNELSFSVEDIIKEYTRYIQDISLFNYMQNQIIRLRENGKIRTAETYSTTLNSFKKFRNQEDLMLDNLTSEIMEAYQAWLQLRGVTLNTISFYARILRAAYNRAVQDQIIENRFPFRHIYTGIDKTVKRAIPISTIKKIFSLDLSGSPQLDYARDLFMLSFMFRGMSFIDMTFLKKTDLCRGTITYRRRKTGQRLSIAWTPEMQRILDKYPENDSEYLLPIIRRRNMNERSVYRNAAYKINRDLKRIASLIDLNHPLTLYVARHSWATAAKSQGIPLNIISEGMGHGSERTTLIYLANLDTSAVDQANAQILSNLS